jgi:WD40 repeat protein
VGLSESELRTAEARVKRERRVNRRLSGALAGIGVVLVLALVAGVAALRSADQAQHDRDRAQQAATLAEAKRAGSQALTNESISTSLLLAAEALRVDGSPQAWENLATTLARAGSLRRIQPTGGLAVSFAASGDGSLVAVSLPVEGTQLFDAKTLAPVPFDDNTPTSAVAFAPDGSLLAAAVNQWVPNGSPRLSEQPVHLYDLPSGELADRQLGGWPSGANVEYSLAFSRDGRRIVAGVNRWNDDRNDWNETGALMVWDVSRPEKPVLKIPVPDSPTATLSPDGDLVYLGATGSRPLRVYDVDRQRLLGLADSNQGGADLNGPMDISPDGSTLALATGSEIRRFDTKRLKPVGATMRGHGGDIMHVEFSHDGSMVLSTSLDRTAMVWDADTGAELQQLVGHNGEIWGGAFSPDDNTVYTGSGDGTLRTWDVTGMRELCSLGKAGDPSSAGSRGVPAPDGRTVACFQADRIWFVDNRTGHETRNAKTSPEVWTSVWSPDSRWLLTTGPGVISVWDARNGGLVDERRYQQGTAVLAVFSSDSERIHVENGYGLVETLERSTLHRVYPWMRLGSVEVMTLVAHPRDGSVIAVREDGSFVRFDPASQTIVDSVGAGFLARETEGVAVSPDGSVMLTVQPSGLTSLLDLATHRWLGEGFDSDGVVKAVYSPDGRQFAVAQPDRIKLWDGATGAYQASLPIPSGTATVSMSYLPDSDHLLVASDDGRVWTVDTHRKDWFDRACAIAGRNLTRDEWSQYFPSRPYQITCPQWPADR